MKIRIQNQKVQISYATKFIRGYDNMGYGNALAIMGENNLSANRVNWGEVPRGVFQTSWQFPKLPTFWEQISLLSSKAAESWQLFNRNETRSLPRPRPIPTLFSPEPFNSKKWYADFTDFTDKHR